MNKDVMIISVIITTYQRKSYVERALSSVLTGRRVPDEIIVIDDGSTDGTEEVVRQFPEVRYVWQENAGISAARNRGIAESSGEWVCFLDVDDEWKKEKLREQAAYHANNPGCLISQTGEDWIRRGKFVNPMKKHAKPEGDVFRACLSLCLITPSAVMMHRSLFDTVGLFDEAMPVCEDYDMWLRVSAVCSVGLVPEKLVVKYGGHDDQLSQAYTGMDRFRICALEKILKDGQIRNDQQTWVITELVSKCQIYATGCQKRGKEGEAEVYFKKISHYQR